MGMRIKDMLEESRMFDREKSDYTIGPRDIRYTASGEGVAVRANGVSVVYKPTDNFLTQVCAKASPFVFGKGSRKQIPVDYLKRIEGPVFAEVVNSHLRAMEEAGKKYLVRTYKDDARAFLSSMYATELGVTNILSAVDTAIDSGKFRDIAYVRPVVTPDYVSCKIVAYNVPGGPYGIGVSIRTDEIGLSRYSISPLIQNTACTNSIVLEEGINVTHRSNGRAILALTGESLQNAFRLSASWLEKYLETHASPIPDFAEVVENLAKDMGWTTSEKDLVLVGSNGKQTFGGLLDGISYMAHAEKDHNPLEQDRIERLAGAILAEPDSLFGHIASLREVIEATDV